MYTFNTVLKPTPFVYVQDKKNIPGVYIIFFPEKGYHYIGSSNKCSHRINQHICDIKKNRHNNKYFINVYKKYNKNMEIWFSYTNTREEALNKEQTLIDNHYNNNNCLNLSSSAFVPKHSEEGRKRLSIKAIKQHMRNGFNKEKIADYHRSEQGRLMHSKIAKKQRENPEYTKNLTNILKEKLKKYYDIYLINPNNEEVLIGYNLREFCRIHQLDRGNMLKVIKGIAKSHKGWRLKNVNI